MPSMEQQSFLTMKSKHQTLGQISTMIHKPKAQLRSMVEGMESIMGKSMAMWI